MLRNNNDNDNNNNNNTNVIAVTHELTSRHAYYLYQDQHTIDEFYASAAVLMHQNGQRRVPFIS